MHHQPRAQTLLVIATSLAAVWLTPAEAQSRHGSGAGHHSHNGEQASAVSTRPAPQPSPRREARPRRSLASPGGLSAANVRPGFYRQLDAPDHLGGYGYGGTVAVPIYLYPAYYPETFYPPASVYSEPAPHEASAPQPQIYVVTPPVISPPAPSAVPPPAPPPVPAAPRSTEPGEVRFSVLPADAKIYLDDDYLGTGGELAAFEQASLFPPGVHVLEVTHPDYPPQRLVFGVSDTDPAHVLIDLSIDRIGRRTRIR